MPKIKPIPSLSTPRFADIATFFRLPNIKVLKNLDLNPNIFFGKVSDIKIKDKLKKLTNDALKKGIFGAPTYYVNRKIFFGQDRLIYAIDEIKR